VPQYFSPKDKLTQRLPGSISAYGTDTFKIEVRAGERMIVSITSDGSTDIDLYIYDENGHLLARDDDQTDEPTVSMPVSPIRQTYIVRVVNQGVVAATIGVFFISKGTK
jgi:hypothetical protein